MLRRPLLLAAFLGSLAALAGCDQLGIESATVVAARVEADGKAVGAACRHGGRAIEDCFALNRKTDKADIYAGWREMDDYMRENKMEAVAPSLAPDGKPKVDKTAAADDAGDGDAAADSGAKTGKPADKAAGKGADKPVAKPGKPEKVAKADAGAKPSKADKPADKTAARTASADADKSTSPH